MQRATTDAIPYTVELLNREQCIELLRTAHHGRVVLSVDCLPTAIPALVEVYDHHLLLGSPLGSLSLAATRGDVVSVEVDGCDDDGEAWSVHATGVARSIGVAEALADAFGDGPLAAVARLGAHLATVPLSLVRGERATRVATS